MAQAESSTAEIPDNWLNDYTDYRQCFVCGSTNPGGLQLIYRQEGDEIVTEFVGSPQHQGFPGVVHRGLLSTLLDETMGRTALLPPTWALTRGRAIRLPDPAPVRQWQTRPARLPRSEHRPR